MIGLIVHLSPRMRSHFSAVWKNNQRFVSPSIRRPTILAEAFTYAFWGCVIGCMIGLPLSKVLYDFLITTHFPYAVWSLPIGALAIIVLFVIVAAVLAAYSTAKRIRTISVTETINEL